MSTSFETVSPPRAADCAYLRMISGLTLAQMAEVVHLADRQSWWRFEAGTRQCGLATWELALLKTDQHPSSQLKPRSSAVNTQSES